MQAWLSDFIFNFFVTVKEYPCQNRGTWVLGAPLHIYIANNRFHQIYHKPTHSCTIYKLLKYIQHTQKRSISSPFHIRTGRGQDIFVILLMRVMGYVTLKIIIIIKIMSRHISISQFLSNQVVKETRDNKNFHTGHWKARDSYFDISVQWLIYRYQFRQKFQRIYYNNRT